MSPGRIVSAAKGCLAGLALGINTLVMSLAMFPWALAKLLIRAPAVRKRCDLILNAIAERWVANNGAWFARGRGARLDVAGVEGLDRRGWYVVTCNHQCWADIFVLQKVLHRRTPLLKFFLKHQLIYVPVIGLAWWALDFPFMRRGGHPDDLAAAEAACARFRAVPTALLNFAEGTRFTPQKARRQSSPYRHLLKPRAGGMAVALATLGDKVDAVLDVTIVYRNGAPSFWQLLCGELGTVAVRIERVMPPAQLLPGTRAEDREFRGQVQAWIGELWRRKDLEIARLGA